MSANASYTQAKNVERRTWDKEVWEAKAKARKEQEKLGGSVSAVKKKTGKRSLDEEDEKEEFQAAAEGAIGPENSERAFLKARRNKVDIDSKIGSTEVVSADAAANTGDVSEGVTKTGVGWHCKVCDCFLKDSHTYLDHINGRKHQRNLGYSMRIERSTTEQVTDRLKKLIAQKESSNKPEDLMGATDVIKMKDEELKRRKEERIKRRKEKKQAKQKEEEDESDEPQIDPAMAAMMGFSGFGGGNKNR